MKGDTVDRAVVNIPPTLRTVCLHFSLPSFLLKALATTLLSSPLDPDFRVLILPRSTRGSVSPIPASSPASDCSQKSAALSLASTFLKPVRFGPAAHALTCRGRSSSEALTRCLIGDEGSARRVLGSSRFLGGKDRRRGLMASSFGGGLGGTSS